VDVEQATGLGGGEGMRHAGTLDLDGGMDRPERFMVAAAVVHVFRRRLASADAAASSRTAPVRSQKAGTKGTILQKLRH
jgi:hypothetical protein